MKKTTGFALFALLALGSLAACGKEEQPPAESAGTIVSTPAQSSQSASALPAAPAAPATSSSPAKEADSDVSQNADAVKDKDLTQMTAADWEKVHLSKKDFDKLLSELGNKTDAENPFQNIAMPDDRTIEITLAPHDGGAIGNALFVGIFDPVLRNLYMHSSYYSGNKQPLIRFLDSSGNVIKENSDFVQPQQVSK